MGFHTDRNLKEAPKAYRDRSLGTPQSGQRIFAKLINYQLSSKLKLLKNCEFNQLTIILTLPLTCELKLPFNQWGLTRGIFNFLNGSRVEARFKLKTTCSDTMIYYRLSQRLKLLGNGEFNHLTIILTTRFNTLCP